MAAADDADADAEDDANDEGNSFDESVKHTCYFHFGGTGESPALSYPPKRTPTERIV